MNGWKAEIFAEDLNLLVHIPRLELLRVLVAFHYQTLHRTARAGDPIFLRELFALC